MVTVAAGEPAYETEAQPECCAQGAADALCSAPGTPSVTEIVTSPTEDSPGETFPTVQQAIHALESTPSTPLISNPRSSLPGSPAGETSRPAVRDIQPIPFSRLSQYSVERSDAATSAPLDGRSPASIGIFHRLGTDAAVPSSSDIQRSSWALSPTHRNSDVQRSQWQNSNAQFVRPADEAPSSEQSQAVSRSKTFDQSSQSGTEQQQPRHYLGRSQHDSGPLSFTDVILSSANVTSIATATLYPELPLSTAPEGLLSVSKLLRKTQRSRQSRTDDLVTCNTPSLEQQSAMLWEAGEVLESLDRCSAALTADLERLVRGLSDRAQGSAVNTLSHAQIYLHMVTDLRVRQKLEVMQMDFKKRVEAAPQTL